jgi:DNA end-binding protein Ku
VIFRRLDIKKSPKNDNKEVVFGEIIKAYEYQPGEYVAIDEKDLEQANAKRTKTIDIDEFTNEREIDVRYFDKPYYLEPDRGADKAYALLRDALQKSGRVAVARFVLRNREHLAAIKPVGDALVLNQMRFPSEIRSPAGLKLPDSKASKPA